ncbi:hypothetical protein [Rhizobium rhizogenes]|jgi:hypothetical protein|uniref:hypothetical protein n=1 Tax=Rhizobium rhizogenes TaxID=359 RepID=UPI0012D2D913|nr:hypothetical protein [Rhizobium rhizogenes]
MLKLLRLPLFRSLRGENSRNPGLWPAHADFSDALHPLRIALVRFTSLRHDRHGKVGAVGPFSSRSAAGRLPGYPRPMQDDRDLVVIGDIDARYDHDDEY